MAWRTLGKDNMDLISQLTQHGIIKSTIVSKAMEATDRKHYCVQNPYMDAPQSIGCGVTISAPHMHAFALQSLKEHIKPGARVLDVGSGSGYLTACFARMLEVSETDHDGIVVGIEHQPSLVELGIKNINNDDENLIKSQRIKILKGDGRLGCPEYAPFDAIHVGAAAPETPQALLDQLKPNGRLIVPVGPEGGTQYLEQYDKKPDGEIKRKKLMAVIFVPLTDLKK